MQHRIASIAALATSLVLIVGCDGDNPAAPSGALSGEQVGLRANHIERLGSCWPNDVAAKLLATGNWETSPDIILCAEGYTPLRLARG